MDRTLEDFLGEAEDLLESLPAQCGETKTEFVNRHAQEVAKALFSAYKEGKSSK